MSNEALGKTFIKMAFIVGSMLILVIGQKYYINKIPVNTGVVKEITIHKDDTLVSLENENNKYIVDDRSDCNLEKGKKIKFKKLKDRIYILN